MKPWDAELIRRQAAGTLVKVAREGRVVLDTPDGLHRIDLSWVDEAALALVQAAMERGESLNLVYPAPAGEVAVLLATQILLHQLIHHQPMPSVGLLSGDPGAVVRLWDEIRIASGSTRVPISSVFPCLRAGANGASPMGHQAFRGLIVGRRCSGWRVNVTVVDELAGPVSGQPTGLVIRVFSDPLDGRIQEAVARGEPVWGWSEGTLGLWNEELEKDTPNTVPFSVAHSRLRAIADGVELIVSVCHNDEAEKALRRLREDLVTLGQVVGPRPARHLELGLRVAWSHTTTLASLPCEPSWYDRFAGVPPRAARATSTFERELTAWAKTLEAPVREYASIVASDIADLRAGLERGNPFTPLIKRAAIGKVPTLAILRTKTAARALVARLGAAPEMEGVGALRVTWLGGLHRLPSWDTAILTGSPPRSVWHRIDSGISRDVRILVLGDDEARRTKRAIRELKMARDKWGRLDLREAAWRKLVGGPAPPPPVEVPYEPPEIHSVPGVTLGAETDPFSPLGALLADDRPLLLDEGSDEYVARPDANGDWNGTVQAIEVMTDVGRLLLPEDEEVDVLSDEPATCIASSLAPGMKIVVGRQSGRVGLIEALEDKLRHRPDLLGARIVVKDYQERIYEAFSKSELNYEQLFRRLAAVGCGKHLVTMIGWVTRGGPMAPRDLEDLEALVQELHLGLSALRVREIFAAVGRIRTFRRAAGRAVARAATEAALSPEDAKVDPATGLSLADLRDAVVIATVESTRRVETPVRLAETGRIEGMAA